MAESKEKKLKILQLPSWYLPEGGLFCLNQTKALQKAGLEVDILANVVLPWRKYKLNIFKFPLKSFTSVEDGVKTFRYYSWKYPLVDIPNIKKWVRKTVDLFDAYIEKHGRPDMIHVHSCMWAGVAAARIKKKYGIPYVLTEHRARFSPLSEYSRSLIKEEYTPFFIESFSNADFIIPVSKQITPKIKEFSSNVPVKVISNITRTDFFCLNPQQRGSRNTFVFFTSNSFIHSKAYDILLPAFDIVCSKHDNVELRIAGNGFSKDDFLKILKETQHFDKIFFCGLLSHDGVRNELWNADTFVLASRTESQSQSTLEALSTGLPVVVTEVVPEEIFSSDLGYRVPVENIEMLAEKMCKVIENRHSYDSKIIREHIIQITSEEIIARQIIEIYNKILNEHA
ncbi:MAG: glycosyltransferase [Dysgonamonadaceae bacterium]|jgi:glycosyltransferase involved in cell wall biosynthesis|nr:glycosyltransferase [Dysgonamonadaceae bacterium]